jgi:hypothetical protein
MHNFTLDYGTTDIKLDLGNTPTNNVILIYRIAPSIS